VRPAAAAAVVAKRSSPPRTSAKGLVSTTAGRSLEAHFEAAAAAALLPVAAVTHSPDCVEAEMVEWLAISIHLVAGFGDKGHCRGADKAA
jgi:hypothetical protein